MKFRKFNFMLNLPFNSHLMASEGNVIYYGFNKKLGKIAREDRWYRRYDNVARPCIEIKNSSEEASTMNGA